jgi:hypothetical protein
LTGSPEKDGSRKFLFSVDTGKNYIFFADKKFKPRTFVGAKFGVVKGFAGSWISFTSKLNTGRSD